MTEAAAPPRAGGGALAARVALLALAVVAHVTGWGISGFGLVAFVFGAPVDPLAILVISAIAAIVLLAVVIASFPLSRTTPSGSRWWVALIGAVVVIAGWVVANVLIVDIGLNP